MLKIVPLKLAKWPKLFFGQMLKIGQLFVIGDGRLLLLALVLFQYTFIK